MTDIRTFQDKNPTVAFVTQCPGCYAPDNCKWDELHHMYIGTGCSRCGYTGKHRVYKPKQLRGYAKGVNNETNVSTR